MSKPSEKQEVKQVLESLYKLAGITPIWAGDINERVAHVVGVMISEVAKCSKAFAMVPQPPGGRATISWLATNFGRGLFNRYREKMSASCARAVLYGWRTELDMAANGFACVRAMTKGLVPA